MRTSMFLSILPLLATALAAPQPRVHHRAHGVQKRTGYMSGDSSSPAMSESSMGHESMKSMTEMSGSMGSEGMGGEKMMMDDKNMGGEETMAAGCCGGESSSAMSSEALPAMSEVPPPPAYSMAAASYEAPPPAYSAPPSQWESNPPGDLNSCVQMCQAQFGGGMDSIMGMDSMGGTPPPTGTESASASGATHTIIVAPTKGVLRFVPFASTANSGDTLHFMWGAGPHTSTLSLGENVCNKSTDANAFDSGKLNASTTFDTVYNGDASTPQFHYCTVGNHCVSGMFGVVNPPTTNVSNALTDQAESPTPTQAEAAGSTAGSGSAGCQGNSMDCWVERWMASSPEAQASGAVVKLACSSAPGSWSWGGKFDMSSLESDSMPRQVMIDNVMYTRLMLASNPSMINGTVSSNYTAVPDLNSFVAQQTGMNSTTSGSAYGGSAVSSSPSASTPAQSSGSATSAQDAAPTQSGGASSRMALTASSTLLGIFGVVLAWL